MIKGKAKIMIANHITTKQPKNLPQPAGTRTNLQTLKKEYVICVFPNANHQ